MSRDEAVHVAARLAVERWMSEGDRKAGEELVAALKRLAGPGRRPEARPAEKARAAEEGGRRGSARSRDL